jgi:hypothetical protein
MKNRVGSLLLKHVGLRKDYVANPRETGYKALHVGVYLDNKSQHNPYTGLKNIEVQLTNELMKYTNNNEKAARDAYKGKHIKGIKAYTEEGTQTKTRPVFVKPPEGSIRLMHVDEEAKVIDLLHMLRGSPTTGVTDDDVLKNAYRVNSVEKGGQEHITLKLTDPIPIIAEAGHHLDVSLIKGKTRQLFNKNTFEAIKESANHVATKEWLHEMYKKLDLN